ncbi:hypothetical protein [Capnocytophaga sputigena]|nr:hypothetical protein [Capnocytophaga sputigena]
MSTKKILSVIREGYDRHRYNLFIDKLFSYALYDKNSDEMERFVRTYLTNGEMGTVFYRNGTPEYIVRKNVL